MGKPINILIVEDSVDDTAILVDELKTAGFDPAWKRVETEPDFLAELKKSPDIILSDYSMPQFSGLRAAQLTQESGLGIPLILISGTVGEDIAVEAMKRGATDYLLKDRIGRLGNAVERALEQKRLRVERKLAEQQLALQATALETAANSIIITDRAGTILWINPAFTLLTGYTPEEIIGKNPRILKSGKHDQKLYQDFWQTITSGKTWRGEFVNRRKDGSLYFDEHTVTPVRDAAGKITHYIGIMHDVTERKRSAEALCESEKQLRQSQKMEAIGQLAGGVAHDFNNILAAIQMQAELLKRSGPLSTEQAEFADEIVFTVNRATALTRQLLLFSRREVFQPKDLDLSESITHTVKMLTRVLGENIQIRLKLADQPMFIHADAAMMDQVLLNLAVNARDAMPNGGHLIIETSGVEFDEQDVSQSANMRAGSFVRLSVSDNGCGIPPEVLPKIFEPFFTTKEVGKGTGLGLATVFGIAQQHRGWVNVYSEINHGTTFRVYLPRLAKNSSPNLPQPALATRSGGQETILLAEDDSALRAVVRKMLLRLGYQVLEAPTGVQALEVWKQNRTEIRLLLTDLVMPDSMTGKDLAQRILQEDPKVKVIYMSGYSAEVVGKDFPLKEGVNFLTKPFAAAKLTDAIRNCLDIES